MQIRKLRKEKVCNVGKLGSPKPRDALGTWNDKLSEIWLLSNTLPLKQVDFVH